MRSPTDETVEKFIALVRIIEEFPGGSVSMKLPDGNDGTAPSLTRRAATD
jgi:hypothetical protein